MMQRRLWGLIVVTLVTLGVGSAQAADSYFDGSNLLLIKDIGSAATSLHLRSDGQHSFVNNMNDFIGNGSFGNGLLMITGQSGISLRYGSANSNGSEAVRISDAGKVGIGVSAPEEVLSVYNHGASATTFQVRGEYPPITENGTNYFMQARIRDYLYNIPSGVTDSGYRIGLQVDNRTQNSDFGGTLETQVGAWILTGAYHDDPSGTIINSYALILENLAAPNVTIQNSYGLFQEGGAKNYLSGRVGIKTVHPGDILTVENDGTTPITFQVRGEYPPVTENGARYYKQAQIREPIYNIPDGVEDGGYRIGLAIQSLLYPATLPALLKTRQQRGYEPERFRTIPPEPLITPMP
jgi:hypothetical protein